MAIFLNSDVYHTISITIRAARKLTSGEQDARKHILDGASNNETKTNFFNNPCVVELHRSHITGRLHAKNIVQVSQLMSQIEDTISQTVGSKDI